MPEGKQIWLNWSSRSKKFDEMENEAKWQATVPDSDISARTILERVPKDILSEWGRESFRKVAANRTKTWASSSSYPNEDAWREQLKRDSKGVIRANHANLLIVLRHHPSWRGVVGYDKFASKLLLQNPVPRHDGQTPNDFKPREWRDADTLAAMEWFQLDDFPTVSQEKVHNAIHQWSD